MDASVMRYADGRYGAVRNIYEESNIRPFYMSPMHYQSYLTGRGLEEANMHGMVPPHLVGLAHKCNSCGAGFERTEQLKEHSCIETNTKNSPYGIYSRNPLPPGPHGAKDQGSESTLHVGSLKEQRTVGDPAKNCNSTVSHDTCSNTGNPREQHNSSQSRNDFCPENMKDNVPVPSENKVISCSNDVCGPGYGSVEYLREQLRMQTSVKPFMCIFCGLCFNGTHVNEHSCRQRTEKPNSNDLMYGNTVEQLRQRISMQVMMKPFLCILCGDYFERTDNISEHNCVPQAVAPNAMENTSKRTADTGFKSHNSTTPKEKPFKCEECDKDFTRKDHLKKHMGIHSRDRPFKCDKCDKSFTRSDHLKEHTYVHTGEKPYMCVLCGKGFKRSDHLKLHNCSQITEKPFKCDMCHKGFARVDHLKKHCCIHDPNRERPFICDICGKNFIRIDHLKKHKHTHSTERPYKCFVCGKGFNRSDHLKKHTDTHSSERPYKCDICGKGFNRTDHLKKHRYIHSPDKPFKCEICGKGFNRSDHLKKHNCTHTNMKAPKDPGYPTMVPPLSRNPTMIEPLVRSSSIAEPLSRSPSVIDATTRNSDVVQPLSGKETTQNAADNTSHEHFQADKSSKFDDKCNVEGTGGHFSQMQFKFEPTENIVQSIVNSESIRKLFAEKSLIEQPGGTESPQTGQSFTESGQTFLQSGQSTTQSEKTFTQSGQVSTQSGQTYTQSNQSSTPPVRSFTEPRQNSEQSEETFSQSAQTYPQSGQTFTQSGSSTTDSGQTMSLSGSIISQSVQRFSHSNQNLTDTTQGMSKTISSMTQSAQTMAQSTQSISNSVQALPQSGQCVPHSGHNFTHTEQNIAQATNIFSPSGHAGIHNLFYSNAHGVHNLKSYEFDHRNVNN